MARQIVHSYSDLGGKVGNTAWYLATNTDVVQFYSFEVPESSSAAISGYTLTESFDRAVLPAAGDKKTAASWAKRLGLGSWTSVRI